MNEPSLKERRFQFRLLTMGKALTAFCVFAALGQFAAGRFVYGWMMWIVVISAMHFAFMCGLTWAGRKIFALAGIHKTPAGPWPSQGAGC